MIARSLFLSAVLLLAVCGAAQAIVFITNGQQHPYLGQVITRAYLNDQEQSLSGGVMEKGYGWTRDAVTSIQFGFGNYYIDTTDVENNPGNSLTETFSISYGGSCVAATFSASSSGTLSNGGTLLTDPISITIPNGGKYEWYAHFTGTGQFVTRGTTQNTGALKDTANGDAIAIGGSDVTASCGTVTDGGASQAMFWPSLGIATTSKPAVLLVGDSRMIGYQDSYQDGAGFIGNTERSIGPNFAELNLGVSGTGAYQFPSNVAKRSTYFRYFSTVIDNYAGNDFAAGYTAAQTVANNQAVIALFPTYPVFLDTVEPGSTSTDSWATTGNQTPLSGNSTRTSYNTSVRSIVAGSAGYFDVTSPVEFGVGSDIWNAPPAITPDGIHENFTGNIDIVTAGVIPASAIHR